MGAGEKMRLEGEINGRSRGRPRSEASKKKILDATRTLLRRGHIRDLTIEGIAKEAGVGKTTIYRWWPNKTAIVMDAFFHGPPQPAQTGGGGSVAESISRHIGNLVDSFRGPYGRVVAEILAEGQSDESVLKDFRQTFLSQGRDAAREAIKRGIARGEFDGTVDIDLAVDMIYGPIYFRLMAGHEPLAPHFARDLADRTLDSIRRIQR